MNIKCKQCSEIKSASFCEKCLANNMELSRIVLDQYVFENKCGVDSFFYRLATSIIHTLVHTYSISEVIEFLEGLITGEDFSEENPGSAYLTFNVVGLIEKCKDIGINEDLVVRLLLVNAFYLYGAETSLISQDSMIKYYLEILRKM